MDYSSKQRKSGPFSRFIFGLWSLLTWIRIAVFNLIFLLIVLMIFITLGSRQTPVLPAEFALRVAPSGMLVDQRSYVDPVSLLLSDVGPEESETVVRDLVEAINFAAEDPRVTSLVLELDYLLVGSISKLQEIGQALNNFKASGKKIIAYGDNFSQDQYYLASYADTIYMSDMGAVLVTGYGTYRNYIKGALDKLEVNFHVFRSGKFKDAVEPLLREDMSDESKEHNSRWLTELWTYYTQQIEQARELPTGTLDEYINTMHTRLRAVGGSSAQLAVENGLVDELKSPQAVQQQLIEELGKSNTGNYYNGIDVSNYLADVRRTQIPATDKIGLLVASGNILDGQQPDGSIGSHTLVDMLQAVREEKRIKALVIRIDSGGGSSFASEVIRQEIQATRDAGIPVFISMGSLAASGGYWIAAAGDQIWATPTTLTGSIGVFGAFPTLEKSLANIGITTDGVGTTTLAGAARPDRALSPQASDIIQLTVDHIYERFINLVAVARNAEPAEIESIAEGRVWSGATAQTLGLVDQLGTLEDVIAAAARHVEIEDYSVELISRPLSPREAFLRQLATSQIGVLAPKAWLSNVMALDAQQRLFPLLKPLLTLTQMNDPHAVYASCLDCVAP